MSAPLSRVPTGIPGFDEMLKGGFLRTDSVLCAGSAGTGKTTLALQYLVNGAQLYGENGIYVTFEELPDQLYRDALNLGMDLKKLENEGKLRVVCTSPSLLLESGGMDVLEQPVRELRASRIVIDSLNHLSMHVDGNRLRSEAYRLVRYLKVRSLSSFLIWEIPRITGDTFSVTDIGLSFVVDTIVMLRHVEIRSSMKGVVGVLKMRGSAHDTRLREYVIGDKGLRIAEAFGDYEGLMTGVPRLAEQTTRKFEEWLIAQPARVPSVSYDKLCAEVLRLPGVRYCAVRDVYGSAIAGGQRPGIPEMETVQERIDSGFRVSLMSAVLSNSPPSFGAPAGLTMLYENVAMLVYPLGAGAVLVASMPPEDSALTRVNIKRIIDKFVDK